MIIRVVIAVLLLALAGEASAEGTPPWSAEVLKVLDGDSLIVRRGRKPVEIRLYGIDCPERSQPYADQARDFTARLAGQWVKIDSTDVDRHGRVVARVWGPDKKELNLELIRAGLAWWYARYAPRETAYAEAQEAARKAKRGLWADQDPVPPWVWRRAKIETP